MTDARDHTINALRQSLRLAFMLMTEYQRDRHTKLSHKQRMKKVNRLKKPGRPREFKGHVPGREDIVQRNEDGSV